MIDLKRLRQDPDAEPRGSRPAAGSLAAPPCRPRARSRPPPPRAACPLRGLHAPSARPPAKRWRAGRRTKEPADELMTRLKASSEEEKALERRCVKPKPSSCTSSACSRTFLLDEVPDWRRGGESGRSHLGHCSRLRLRPQAALGARRSAPAPRPARGRKDYRLGVSALSRPGCAPGAGPGELHARFPRAGARLSRRSPLRTW